METSDKTTTEATHLPLPLDYGLIIDSRALELMRSHAEHSLGGFTCSGNDLNLQFHQDAIFRPLVEQQGQQATREYEKLDPSRDCLILFDGPTPMTVDLDDRKVRVKARALLIKKGKGTKYHAIN